MKGSIIATVVCGVIAATKGRNPGRQDSLTRQHGRPGLSDIADSHLNSHHTPIDRPPCLCYKKVKSVFKLEGSGLVFRPKGG